MLFLPINSHVQIKSGMSVSDTLEFVLSCYDFDGTGRLTIDEISLAFKSTVTGMCKLEGTSAGADAGLKACPRDADFETAAMNAFERRAEGSDRFKVKARMNHGAGGIKFLAIWLSLFHREVLQM